MTNYDRFKYAVANSNSQSAYSNVMVMHIVATTERQAKTKLGQSDTEVSQMGQSDDWERE